MVPSSSDSTNEDKRALFFGGLPTSSSVSSSVVPALRLPLSYRVEISAHPVEYMLWSRHRQSTFLLDPGLSALAAELPDAATLLRVTLLAAGSTPLAVCPQVGSSSSTSSSFFSVSLSERICARSPFRRASRDSQSASSCVNLRRSSLFC